MAKFNLGDVIEFGKITGYVVGIDIDPLTSYQIFEEINDPIYTIRAFGDWWENGYYDFRSTESNMRKLEEILK